MKVESTLVVGGGAMAVEHHLPRLKKYLDCHDITVFEVQQSRCEELKYRFKFDRGVRITNQLPEDANYDLVVIATPPKFHLEYFKKLSGRSQNFLIEKPMTIDQVEAAELESIAESLGKTVYVNLLRRTLQSFQLIKQIIHSGAFGDLKCVNVSEGMVFQWDAVSTGSFSRNLNGGGVLMDTGPHAIDQMFQVFDELTFHSCVMDAGKPAIEANCKLSLAAANGVPVEITLSRNRSLSNTARFEFSKAILDVGVLSELVHVEDQSGLNYQISADGVSEDVNWMVLVDQFYERYLAQNDNTGVGPSESRTVAGILDKSYSEATIIAGVF